MICFLLKLFNSFYFLTGSYSINVFPEPLSNDEEKRYIEGLINYKLVNAILKNIYLQQI